MFGLLLLLLLLPLDLGLKQSSDLFVSKGLNVTISCSQIGTSHNSMYWFRQTSTEPLEQIVYFYVATDTWENNFDQRASAVRNGASLDLTLLKLQISDSGVYFCAKQDAQQYRPIYKLNKNMQSFPCRLTSNTCSSAVRVCFFMQG
ncbi:hypothetical protein R3I93_011325 [Phoxinus phoxinus]|uniref:Ig-like domain-containing protein n=1 Tax=Phoxinus phoxinus TaxID=58324 RepID=A0AAN9CXW6_9TELE